MNNETNDGVIELPRGMKMRIGERMQLEENAIEITSVFNRKGVYYYTYKIVPHGKTYALI